MGEDVTALTFTREHRQRYREKLRRCLDVFARMLAESKFDFQRPLTGLEIEFNLVDGRHDPAMRNAEVLNAIANDDFQTELGQFNIEINVRPRSLQGGAADPSRDRAAGQPQRRRGTFPGRGRPHRHDRHPPDPDPRPPHGRIDQRQPALLADQRTGLRGPGRGHAHRHRRARSAGHVRRLDRPRGGVHQRPVPPPGQPPSYANHWNAAQCLAGVQLALGANSPFLFGKELWRETRVALFEQATDTRPPELKAQGVRPRVWFGERWITSIFDQFEENVSYFPALLPICDDEDPDAVLARGDTPGLGELRMHNGTIYRWNRPVYDVFRGKPHLRVENRVLPAGPTVVDILANGAFYYGLIRVLAEQERPVWSQMSFAAAEDNFNAGARRGIDSTLYWPGVGEVPATELVLRRLLPLAHQGLAAWNVDPAVGDRLLGIIERRCISHQNGAEWQARTFHRLDEERQPLDRRDALREMLARYVDLMHSNEPVHTWPVG